MEENLKNNKELHLLKNNISELLVKKSDINPSPTGVNPKISLFRSLYIALLTLNAIIIFFILPLSIIMLGIGCIFIIPVISLILALLSFYIYKKMNELEKIMPDLKKKEINHRQIDELESEIKRLEQKITEIEKS